MLADKEMQLRTEMCAISEGKKMKSRTAVSPGGS